MNAKLESIGQDIAVTTKRLFELRERIRQYESLSVHNAWYRPTQVQIDAQIDLLLQQLKERDEILNQTNK
jgi:hypothetical protein